jgi:hypothetical protein
MKKNISVNIRPSLDRSGFASPLTGTDVVILKNIFAKKVWRKNVGFFQTTSIFFAKNRSLYWF